MPGIEGYGLEVAIGTITIMIAIGGITTGLGFALNNRKLKEFGIEEISQSIINGALVGGFVLLFMQNGIVTNLVNSIALTNTTSIGCTPSISQNYAICFAYDYLVGTGYSLNGVYHSSILSQSSGLMLSLIGLNTALGIIAGASINAIVVSISFSSMLNPIISQIQYFVKVLTTISISSLVQSSLLLAISSSATTLILPIGLIMRTFYPTRKTGGFLIATAIGMYVVFPLSYVFNANLLNQYSLSTSNSTIVQLSGSASNTESQILSISGTPKVGVIASIVSTLNGITSAFSGIVNMAVTAISYFILAAFILPAFSLILSIISIREMSGILGTEISFTLFNMV